MGQVPADLRQFVGLSEFKRVSNTHFCFSHLFAVVVVVTGEMMLEDFSYSISEGSTGLLSLPSPSCPPLLPLTNSL